MHWVLDSFSRGCSSRQIGDLSISKFCHAAIVQRINWMTTLDWYQLRLILVVKRPLFWIHMLRFDNNLNLLVLLSDAPACSAFYVVQIIKLRCWRVCNNYILGVTALKRPLDLLDMPVSHLSIYGYGVGNCLLLLGMVLDRVHRRSYCVAPLVLVRFVTRLPFYSNRTVNFRINFSRQVIWLNYELLLDTASLDLWTTEFLPIFEPVLWNL